MTAKLTASLRQAPATVPCLAAIALMIVWSTDQAGYPVTHWAPGAVLVLVLLAIAALALRRPRPPMPLPVVVSLGAFTAFTAFSYLSIAWAASPGDALEGADRTLLYLLVFALFACWPQRGASATALLSIWTLSITGLGVYVLARLGGASQSGLQSLVPGGRLDFPSGYPNANAAEWLMAFWPALLLARERGLPWALRGLLAGAAVVLAEVALLSQSRGSLYATPITAALVFALLPARTRTFALLVPVAAGIAAAAPAVLHVGDHLRRGEVVASNVHSAVTATLLAALAVALVVGAGAFIEARRNARAGARPGLLHRLTAAAGVLALVAVLAGGLAAAGNPVTRVEKAWHSFKGGYGGIGGGDRLVSGLGSNRYDFYRVALDQFGDHPAAGIGADNFQQQYLREGRSNETPRYPHSVELRTLAQTGVIGTLLAVIGLGAALLAGWRAARSPDRLGAGVAAAALGGFGYWAVHGSVDWFWEFAGLGAPAFAMLGLACALAPRRARAERAAQPAGAMPPGPRGPTDKPAAARAPGSRRLPARPVTLGLAALCVVLALGAAAALVGPWLSALEVQQAARIWTRAPRTAYSRLQDAAKLEPFGDEAYLTAGSIALRRGELARGDREFARALGRVPDDAYATLERGAIASTRGERAAALALLERAARLNPRDALTREALELARRGRRVDVQKLNLLILLQARQLA
ncbi:MAG TPA: O-antigen ligase family protein [Solirubrobacteraceae bacterium]|jgi:O-antigen ligase|nr:O-antigen ligase family protein [Solirubrobacteraceae bacterium]